MPDLTPSMPASPVDRFNGAPFGAAHPNHFSIKIKIRYLVEKLVDGHWVVMARLSDSARITELSEALGGTIRVQDLTAGQTLPEKEFP